MSICRYHCRPCGAHFTSLESFDAHRVGPMDARRCELADAALVELSGTCNIAGPMPIVGTTVYEHERAKGYREYRKGENVRENAPTDAKQAA